MKTVQIRNIEIGYNKPCFIIAEAGVNHNGDLKIAKKLIDIANDAGADAVKFQTFSTDDVLIKETPKADYQTETTGKGTMYDMVKKLELSLEDFKILSEYSSKKDIMFLSTPFDEHSVNILDSLNVPAFKISSGDLINLPFLDYIAKKDKFLVLVITI